ncbi:hypothetical protein ED312_20920 [Sinomicrobium pectinilyticum]|uniref:YtkA-like domain-containing protein n=1 Tax=Sinomicrobium pectinilyticum TaxID=1084421 RepID=A0A3N0DP26_SINP1|nr:hypothetical protein [Sinomicrobium pectinilyticum]RNL77398.1 hypothetical protein ED312_20920 [Sinomicrobium pectinilyticum]
MKIVKSLFLVAVFICFVSCASDNDEVSENDPVAGLNLVTSFEANGHTVELYSENSGFTTGYNEVSIRIKDIASDRYFSDSEIAWTPVMHMTDREHSCPKSGVTLTENNTVSKGFLIFQMTGNAEEYWSLILNYKIGGTTYEAEGYLEVNPSPGGKQKITVFKGSDDTRYILAMIGPVEPEVKINGFVAGLYKMEDMMNFSAVENYRISVDPRMPGMDNHGSPNNEDLTYDVASGIYRGKLSFTMTGYWKINLRLLNDKGEVIKGEDVTEETPASSLYFEVEF